MLVMLPPGADAPNSGPAEFGQLGIARVEPLRSMRGIGEKGRVHHAIGGGFTDKPVSEMNEAERAAFNNGPWRITTPPVTPAAAMKEKLKGLGARVHKMASPPAPRVMADSSPGLVLGSPGEPPAPPAWTHTLQSEVKAMRDLITKSLTMQEVLMGRVATLEAANAKLQESAERQEKQACADTEGAQDAALMSRLATLEAANAKLQESAERQERQAGADAEVVQDAKTLMEECVEMMEVRLAEPEKSSPPQVKQLEAMIKDMEAKASEHKNAMEAVLERTRNAAGGSASALDVLISEDMQVQKDHLMADWEPAHGASEELFILNKLGMKAADMVERPLMSSMLAIRGYAEDLTYVGGCKMDAPMCWWSRANWTRGNHATADLEYAAVIKGRKTAAKPSGGLQLGAARVTRTLPTKPANGWVELRSMDEWRVACAAWSSQLAMAGREKDATNAVAHGCAWDNMYTNTELFIDFNGLHQFGIFLECERVARKLLAYANVDSWNVTRDEPLLKELLNEYSLRARRATQISRSSPGGGGGAAAAAAPLVPAPKAKMVTPKRVHECIRWGWSKLKCAADGNRPYCLKSLFGTCGNNLVVPTDTTKGCVQPGGAQLSHYCVRCECLHKGGKFQGNGECSGKPIR